MSERPINLETQRLSVSQELGADFASALEGGALTDERQGDLIKAVQAHVSVNPETRIIGTKLNKESTFLDIATSLSRQMGLPPDSKLRDVGDRLTGRESSFLLVFPGADELSERKRKRFQKKLKKLGAQILFG